MSKPSAPPAPDYVGAAKQQGASNLETAIAQSKLANPWQTNALGSRTIDYSGNITGDPLVPYVRDSLTPLGEARQAQEGRIISNLGDVAESGLGRVSQAMATPFSFASADEAQKAAEGAYLDRLNPIFQRDEDALRTRLATQGLTQGSEAWRNEMDNFGRAKNDALSQAVLKGFEIRPQTIQQESFLRNIPLNELNALRTGSQVSMPQFQGFQGGNIAPTPIANAAAQQGQYAGDVYNADVGTYNSQMGALGTLGAAGLLSYFAPFALSDARAKEDIKPIGKAFDGTNLYSYRYKGSPQTQVGVMAQEVEETHPEAVAEIGGLKHVDYSQLFSFA